VRTRGGVFLLRTLASGRVSEGAGSGQHRVFFFFF
jgi:hypothetical protein